MTSTKCFIIKGIASLLALLLGLMAVGGCAAGPEEVDLSQTELPVASELPIPESGETTVAGETLRLAYVAYSGTLHPLADLNEDIANIFSLIFEPAIKVTADGRFSASVIESWNIEENGTRFVFNVRKGVVAHDGSQITADDIVFTANAIRGLSASVCPYARYAGNITGVTKTGDYQVTVTLSAPTNDIYYFMSFPVIPMSYYQSEDLTSTKTPVGTGAYRVESYSQQDGFQLTANEEWWRQQPAYGTVTAIPAESEEQKAELFTAGEVDAFASSLDTINSYSAEKDTNVHGIVTPEYVTLIPNFRNSALREQSVRKAISLAIDRSDVLTNSVAGEGLATETPLRPDLWYFSDDKDIINGYNLNRAMTLLEEAGYTQNEETGIREKDGQPLSLDIIYTEASDLHYRSAIVGTLRKQLEDAGIELNVVELEQEEYQTAMATGDFDLALAVYYTNTNNDIRYIFEDSANYGNFDAAELLSLADAAKSAVTEEDLQTAYSALSSYLVEQLPHIGLFFREHALVTRSDIQVSQRLRFKQVYADVCEWQKDGA